MSDPEVSKAIDEIERKMAEHRAWLNNHSAKFFLCPACNHEWSVEGFMDTDGLWYAHDDDDRLCPLCRAEGQRQ